MEKIEVKKKRFTKLQKELRDVLETRGDFPRPLNPRDPTRWQHVEDLRDAAKSNMTIKNVRKEIAFLRMNLGWAGEGAGSGGRGRI